MTDRSRSRCCLALCCWLLALAGCPEQDRNGDASPSLDRYGALESGVDPQLRERIFKEVHDYLTAEDPGPDPPLLSRLDTSYKEIPFALFAEAVRHWPTPATFASTGMQQITWTNPLYQGEETLHVYIPSALAKAEGPRFPLLVYLHGAGGSGAEIAAQPLRAVADKLGAILAAPTSNAKCDWSFQEDCMSQAVLLVQHLKRRYPVDDARVVLTGFSMGGRGAFSVGVAYPDPYCGVVPVAGTIGAVKDTPDLSFHKTYCCPHMENTRNLRLHYISGDQDVALLLYQNRGCELCIQDLGLEQIYTELKGQGHVFPVDLWEQAVQWALQKPRQRYPSTVIYNLAMQASSFLPDGLWVQTKLKVPQYWAVMEAPIEQGKPARLEAKLSGNKILLTSTNVARVSIYLGEEMLDLDQPVTIERSGEKLFTGLLERDRRLLLTEARRRSERSMTFAAHKSIVIDSP